MWIVNSPTDTVLTPSAIALGNFDGIHLGHQRILQPIINAARENLVPHTYATVVSFNPHPQEFFTGQKRQLLTPLAEKIHILEQLGIEQLILLPFDQKLANLSPQEFFESILIERLQAKRISVGQDFRFGCKRAGSVEDLRYFASQYGVGAIVNSLHTCSDSIRMSSSLIRQALAQGALETVRQMLGRTYTLTGTVITGRQLGRTIGFPTANLQLPVEKLLPRFGVYCVKVFLEDPSHAWQPGVMNIGCRPTVDGQAPTVEVHLLDWSGDLYGQTLTVSLEAFLRPEEKFASLDALKAQIVKDCNRAKEILEVQV